MNKYLKQQTDDDEMSYPAADMSQFEDMETDELSELLAQQQFTPEDYAEIARYKKSSVMQPMQFKTLNAPFKRSLDDDLWNGVRGVFEWNLSPMFRMEYSLVADNLKNLKNYRTSAMLMNPGNFII